MIGNVLWLFIGIIIGVSVGTPLGYYLSGKSVVINLRVFAGYSVLTVWFIFLIGSIINTDIVVPFALHGIAGGIVSALFGEEYFKK